MACRLGKQQANCLCCLQVHRCRGSITFSLLTAWLLGAYCSDTNVSSQRLSRGSRLRKLILSDQLSPTPSPSLNPSPVHPNPQNCLQYMDRSSNRDLSCSTFNGPTGPGPDPNDHAPNDGEVSKSPSKWSHQGSLLRLDIPKIQEEVR